RSQPLYVKTIYLGFQILEGDFIFQNDLLFTTDMRTIYIINMSIGIPRIERTSQPYVSDAGFSMSGHCQLIFSSNILILTDQILGVLIFDLTIPPEEDDATDTESEDPGPDDPSFFNIPGFGILELLGVVIVSVALLTLKNKRINHNLEG
ncbi:MAG: hypothetical protein ACTSYI_11555, partial [Promethearchaeota archaeon]